MLVSTIIPVYNAEKYICRCLDSILQAQIPEVENEIILVDDGSGDNSLTICKGYARKYPNIKVFSQKNQGPSMARNVGLDQALGEWITFVDGDDWVNEEYFITLKNLISTELELALFGYNKILRDSSIINKFSVPGKIDSKQILADTLTYNNIIWFPWNKLYKKEILKANNIKFSSKIRIGEDTLFNLAYIQFVKQIEIINTPLYNYVEVEDSLTQKKFKSNLLENMESHYLERKKLQPENVTDISMYYVNHTLFWLIKNIKHSPNNKLQELKQVRNSIIYTEVFKNYKYNFKQPKLCLIVKLFQFKQFNLLIKILSK